MATKKSYQRGPLTSILAGAKSNFAALKRSGAAQIFFPFNVNAHKQQTVNTYQQYVLNRHQSHKNIIINPVYNDKLSEQLFEKAQKQYDNQNTEQVFSLLNQALATNPYNTKAIELLALANQNIGNTNHALSLLAKARAVKKYNKLSNKQKHNRLSPLHYNYNVNLNNLLVVNYSDGKGVFTRLQSVFSKAAATVALLFLLSNFAFAFENIMPATLIFEKTFTKSVKINKVAFLPKNFKISGTITDKNTNEPLEGINITAYLVSDTTKKQTTFTNSNGVYNFNDFFTIIDDTKQYNQSLTICNTDNSIVITAISNSQISNAYIYNINGSRIATVVMHKLDNNIYRGKYRLGVMNNVVIVNINNISCKHLTKNNITTVKYKNNQYSNRIASNGLKIREINNMSDMTDNSIMLNCNLKSSVVSTKSFGFKIVQPNDLLQPIDTIIADIDINTEHVIDFEMKKWPEFFANIYFNLQDKFGNQLNNTTININETNGSYSLSANTDENGNAEITNIKIPSLDNKLNPDSLDFALEIKSEYLQTFKDTLRNVTNGDLIKKFDNLSPKQQEFFANLYLQTNKQDGTAINEATAKLWELGSNDTLTSITNNEGKINFENINIDALNEITPDTINYILKLSANNMQTIQDTIKLTNGDFNKTYTLNENEPDNYEYQLIINSQDENNLNLNNVNWTILNSDSTLIQQGNTGNNALDTITFNNKQSSLDIILKTNIEEHTNYRKALNINGNETTNEITKNELLKYLYQIEVTGKDIEDGTNLDSINVKMNDNQGNILAETNSLGNLIAQLETTQPGHNMDVELIISRPDYINDTIETNIIENEVNQRTFNLTPTTKEYTLIINSQNNEGENLNNVNWTILNSDSTLIQQGNTGNNALDTINFTSTKKDLDIILKTNLEEHTNYRKVLNINANQIITEITKNELLKYLYELNVTGKDSETGTALDSISVEAFQNGNLLMQGESLENTIAELQTTQAGHTLDLKLVIDRNGYVKSDSISTTITEGMNNEVSYDLVKEIPEQQYSVIRRGIRDPLNQLATNADIIITNNQFNYNDTIFNVENVTLWTDTVPVNSNGITEYSMKIIPHVQEGNIPLYTENKILELTPGTMPGVEDLLKALEQQQKIKGKVILGDSKANATGIDIIIWNTDRTQVIDSIRSEDGTYEFGPYATGFEGQMDIHIPNDHQTRMDTSYFGHKGIPIIQKENNHYGISGGPVLLEDKVTHFEDSVKTYNAVLTPTYWTDAETGELAKVNPAHIYIMDGDNSYDMPLLEWGETNTYFKPTSINNPWVYEMAKRIRDNFGIPFVINEVNESLPANGINITSMDENYLNSVKNQMGMNIEVSASAGYTSVKGTDELEDINVHSVTDIRIRGPPAGDITGDAFSITASERELVHRMAVDAINIPLEYYKSIGNESMPNDLDTAKMVYDHINYSIMDNNRRLRVNQDEKERIHNGTWTIRPNNNEDYYSNTTNGNLYQEERWKHWDTTNIPEYNTKFFE